MTINLRVPDTTELKPRITVFGIGGAGGNAVNNMIAKGVQGVEFVVANTDAQALSSSAADRRIQMGANVTEGLGAGSKPEIGAAAAEEAMADIKAHLAGSHMVFITAGMGGGTGTGAAPVIARASREEGILTVGVVTKPFQFEGARRMRSAEQGITHLEQYVDTLLVIPNQNLFRIANEKTTFADAFAMADDVLRSGVSCITDLMVKEGLINLDFADVRAIMAGMGKAMMGTGESDGERRAVEAAEQAISNPLLDDISMRGASGLLVSITGGNDLTLFEVDEAASRIRAEADEEANIIVGATFDDALDGRIRVSVVATGLGPIELEEAMRDDKPSLTERLAGLGSAQGQAKPEPSVTTSIAQPKREDPSEPPVWQAPGNVTIERRRPPVQPHQEMGQQKAPAAQPQFKPAPPASGPRNLRRMPNVEELPIVAQKEIRATSGEQPAQGLEAHKRKVGFLERLAGVGRGIGGGEEADSEKREPDFGGETPQAKPAEAKQTRSDRSPAKAPVTPMPRREEAASRPEPRAGGEKRLARESDDGDELEIPAFLRRQAN